MCVFHYGVDGMTASKETLFVNAPDKLFVSTDNSNALEEQYPTQATTPPPPWGPPGDTSNDVLAEVDVASGVRQYCPVPILVTETQPTSPSG